MGWILCVLFIPANSFIDLNGRSTLVAFCRAPMQYQRAHYLLTPGRGWNRIYSCKYHCELLVGVSNLLAIPVNETTNLATSRRPFREAGTEDRYCLAKLCAHDDWRWEVSALPEIWGDAQVLKNGLNSATEVKNVINAGVVMKVLTIPKSGSRCHGGKTAALFVRLNQHNN
jgi:hypothetical protein